MVLFVGKQGEIMTDKLLCVHRGGTNDSSLYWCSATTDYPGSLSWSGDTRMHNGASHASQGLALAVFGDKVCVAYCSDADSPTLMFTVWDKALQAWSAPVGVGDAASCTPALCVFGQYLYCVIQAPGSSHMIWYRTADARTWNSGGFSQDNQMCAGASLVVAQKKSGGSTMYCFHRGRADDGPNSDALYYAAWNGSGWDADVTMSGWSSSGPSTVLFDDRIFRVTRGKRRFDGEDQHIYTTRYKNDGDMLPDGDEKQTSSMCYVGPSIAISNGSLYCVHRGYSGSERLYYCAWNGDANAWSGDISLPGNQSMYEVGLAAVGAEF
jgi:hypothetical protein